MSSSVARKHRVQKKPRTNLSDFGKKERIAIDGAIQNFGKPIAIYGSRVKGDWAKDSDIDIGVNGYNSRLHKPIVELIQKVSGIKVDLVKYKNALTHKNVIDIK